MTGAARAEDEHPNRDRLDVLFGDDPYGAWLGARLREWSGGRATLVWTPSEQHVNFAGFVHGGALFSLADLAFAVASNSWGRVSVALTIEAHYLAAPRVGSELVAVATERSRSRRTASYLIEVRSPASDIELRSAASDVEVRSEEELVGSFHAMVFRTGRWHFGEDAWPDGWRETH